MRQVKVERKKPGNKRAPHLALVPKKIDVDSTQSDKPGFLGFFESSLRQFKKLVHVTLLLPIYAISALIMGLSAVPGIYAFHTITEYTQAWSSAAHYLSIGFALAIGYMLYGFGLLFVVPACNFIFRMQLSEWRGPYYSLATIRWYLHNALTYIMRYTFLEFITPTPFNYLFYKWMGMKLGRGVEINTSNISDPSLIEIGDKTTIGGSVFIVGHYGQAGFLVLAKVKIGKNVTLGLKSTVMGGVEIGDNAKIMPHSVLMPKTIVPAGEVWGGVPAQKIEIKKN